MDSPDIKHFLRWLEIRERHGQDVGSAMQLYADADHSALLSRLRAGKEPFDEPPPLAMSYPWYELLEKGRADAFSVQEVEYENWIIPKGHLIIDQHGWKIIEKLEPEVWIVTYYIPDVKKIEELRRTPGAWNRDVKLPKTLSASRWKVYSPGIHPQVPERRLWILERISPQEPQS